MGMSPHTGLGARRKTHGAKTCDRWPEFVPATAHAGVRVRILFLWERLKVRPKRLVCFGFFRHDPLFLFQIALLNKPASGASPPPRRPEGPTPEGARPWESPGRAASGPPPGGLRRRST